MENLKLTFNIIAPLLCYMLLGAFFRHVGIVTEDFRNRMNKLLVKAFVPVSVFNSLSTADLSSVSDMGYILYALFANMLFFFLMIAVCGRFIKDPARRGSFIQGSTRGNGVIFGIPLAIAVFGEAGALEMALMLALLVPYYNTFEVVMIEICGEKARMLREGGQSAESGKVKVDYKKIGKSLLTNGILWGVFLGLMFNFLQLRLPPFLITVTKGIGGCVSPVAFMMAGAAFSFKAAGANRKLLSLAIAIKLVILPAIFLILPVIWGYTDKILLCMLVAFAVPTAIVSYPMAKAAGCDGDLAAEIVAFTTALSMFTMFLWIFLFKSMGML